MFALFYKREAERSWLCFSWMLERYRGSNEKVYMNINRLKKIVRKKKKRITVPYIFCVSENFIDFIFCNLAGDSSDVFVYASYPTTSIIIGTACDADEIADFERFSYSVPRYMMKTFFRNIHFVSMDKIFPYLLNGKTMTSSSLEKIHSRGHGKQERGIWGCSLCKNIL